MDVPDIPNPTGGGYSGLSEFGGVLAVAGLVQQAIGAFYSAKSAQYQAKAAASTADFERSIANINARSAELEAESILTAGQREAGRLQLGYRETKGSQRVSQAAAGIQAGVGSAAEVQATTEIAKEIDSLAITANSVRAANAARARATEFRNRGLLAGVSAANLRGSAHSISPGLAAGTSLLGGAGTVASQWAASRKLDYLYSRGGSS